jgi:hypothetical protein
MHADDGYFDERVAAHYDESSAEMLSPAVVEPAVDFLTNRAKGRSRARRETTTAILVSNGTPRL